MPFGCFVALRSLSHSLLLLQPSFGQLLVSFAPLHSLRPSFRYHYTTFIAIRMLHFMASHLQPHKCHHTAGSTFHSQNLRYNTHWVSLSLHYVLHSFQSHTGHPLPSVLVLALRPPGCVTGHRWHHPSLIRLTPYATQYPFTVCPSLPTVALLATPAGGTRRQFRRTSSIAFEGEQPDYSVDKCATRLNFLLAAGAITFAKRCCCKSTLNDYATRLEC